MGLKEREYFLGLCTMEDEGASILQNKSKPSPSDDVSDPRRRQLKHSTTKISKLTRQATSIQFSPIP